MTLMYRVLSGLIFVLCMLAVAIHPEVTRADSAIMPSCAELPGMVEAITAFQQQLEKDGLIDPDGVPGQQFNQLVASLANMAEASYDYELGREVAALDSVWKTRDWEQMKHALDRVAVLFARGVKRECGGE